MSTQTAEILYNVTGQTLVYSAPEGRPDVLTSVTIYPSTTGDDGTAESAFSSSTIVSTPDTTVDAVSGLGQDNPRKISLAATTGIETGGVYLLTGASGEKEWVEVVEIVSGDSVIARAPLHHAFAVSSTFETTQLSGTFDSTWIQDSSNISATDIHPEPGYRARWVYTYNSETFVKDTYFDVVRYQGGHNITPADMERFMPSWRNILPTSFRDDNGRGLIAEAYTQVKMDLYGLDRADEMARDRETMDELVKNKCRELILFQRFFETASGGEVADEARTQYQYRLDSLIAKTSRMPFSTGSGGGSAIIEPPSIWSR